MHLKITYSLALSIITSWHSNVYTQEANVNDLHGYCGGIMPDFLDLIDFFF